MEDERLVTVRLDLTGQVGLLDGRIDMRIAVVLEHPEVAVQPHIDARGLHHRRVERVNANPPGIDLGPEVLI